jgi:TolB-like protein/Tfp pilus assembly protein PilF
MKRRLAAILAADMVGYSRLMAVDEQATADRLKAHTNNLIEPKITGHGGRIVKTMGDGFLVEFASAIEATHCAIELQRVLRESERDVPEDKRICYRVGINLGDILIDGEDVIGDGVNIAARIEALAEPGGVYISDLVYQSLQGKFAGLFSDMGEKELKNMTRKVRIWAWQEEQEKTEDVSQSSESVLPLPNKPSIAVLPFANMSGDPEQEFFADGITEDIITALSRVRWLFVIARNSSFHYKGRSQDVRKIAQLLGVKYVLEGSVRRAGDRVRITAQLIDARSGNHIWAERYDRQLADIFEMQDEITASIAANVDVELADSERDFARTKPTSNLDAWETFQRGMWHFYRFTTEDTEEALQLFRHAIELDPTFARAHAGISLAHFSKSFLSLSAERTQEIHLALASAKRAVECDERDPYSHWVLGRAHLLSGKHDSAISEFETAILLNPSFASGYYSLGWALSQSGRPEEGIVQLDKALRLSPHDPLTFAILAWKSMSFLLLGRLDEAWECVEKASRQPNAHFLTTATAVIIAAQRKDFAAAEQFKKELLVERPDFEAALYLNAFPFEREQDAQICVDGLRSVGIG